MRLYILSIIIFFFIGYPSCTSAQELPDIHGILHDLFPPPMTTDFPAPGKRVKQVVSEYKGTAVYHTLYLPADWKSDSIYPVIVEYAGNGNFKNQYGDTCTGKVEDCNLGYGISGGKNFIWICLPYISEDHRQNQLLWWGDIDATVDYCKKIVPRICETYGGDPSAVILTGFSRGAIACNYIGLHDDEIARLWLAFIVHSHYDGVRQWEYPESDRRSALKRLERLKGRAQFISHEQSIESTQKYAMETGIAASLTFLAIPYRNHTDSWMLRDIPERKVLRKWLENLIKEKHD